MKVSQKSRLLVAAIITLPALAQAAQTPDYLQSRRPIATTRSAAASPGRGLAQMSLAQMNLAPRFYLKRPYAPRATLGPMADTPTTALSRQIASDGPVGSVGLINLSGSRLSRDRDFGDSLASQRGLPSRALGFNVSYNFP
jgi:hypothetical protein